MSLIGRKISSYQLAEKIGSGGMGEVYEAEDTRLGRRVAVKILSPTFADDPLHRRRLEREAKAASTLNHPNIVQVYDVGEVDGNYFIVMEYVDGSSLGEWLAERGRGGAEIVAVASQIALALAEAHAHGITHRDIKATNIMVTPDGQAKVLDFGLAKVVPGAEDVGAGAGFTQELTAAGMVVGTVRYMSPEQALGKEIDGRSDLFSFGVLLYEMATGRLPFVGRSAIDTIDKIVHAEPATMASSDRQTPAGLEAIVAKCLEKSPERRYQTADEIRLDLLRLDFGHVGGDTPFAAAATTGAAGRALIEVEGYRVLKKIAEGGMGVVYEAEQMAPIRRRVALKVIKRGMDTKEVIARFEAERQALAMMDHSNISRRSSTRGPPE